MPELPWGGIEFSTVFGFDNDEFKTEEDVREAGEAIGEIIGIDRIESDVTFATDLGIGTARQLEVDRDW